MSFNKFDRAAQNNSLEKNCIQKCYVAVKHKNTCFLTNLVKIMYLEVLLDKSDAYKSKCIIKTFCAKVWCI